MAYDQVTMTDWQAQEDNPYVARIREIIDDAIDFEDSYLSLAREENLRYYHGYAPELDDPTEETRRFYTAYDEYADDGERANKSTYVSTDVRDTILTILPSLIRIFMSDEYVAEFVPNSAEGQEAAEQQRDYVNHVFYRDNNGFLILYEVFKDALTTRYGVTTWWTDQGEKTWEEEYSNLSPEQVQIMLMEAEESGTEAKIVEFAEQPSGSANLTVQFRSMNPRTMVAAVPPDELRINRGATSFSEARLIGREWLQSVSELVRMGYDRELVEQHLSDYVIRSDERFIRNPALVEDRRAERSVNYGEFYIMVDGDDDGIDELHKICTIGDEYVIVNDELVSEVPMALWLCDPIPHTAIGDSMADLVKDLQRIKTFMTRAQLDNLAETVHPKTVVNSMAVNMDDVLNDDVGAVIPARGDPNAAISFLKTPYYGKDVQESVNYLDDVRAARTGITEASKGLDPDSLQSTTLTGVNAILTGAQERIETIARVLAETGLRKMMVGLTREVINNPNPSRVIRIRGEYTQIDPSIFDPDLAIEINPYLGKGTDLNRMHALQEVRAVQTEIISRFGISNPIVTPREFMHTVEDLMRLANIKNINRYFRPITDELLQAISQEPQEPDPASVLAQAELEKVKKDVLIAMGKNDMESAKLAMEQWRAKEQADYNRDKLDVETATKVLEIMSNAEASAEQARVAETTARIQARNKPAGGSDGQ